MLNYDNFAITLGRAVEVFRRRPDAVPEQKVALRALVALATLDGVVVRLRDDGAVTVEDYPVARTLPGIELLAAQMEGHSVREIRVVKGAPPAELLELLRALAVPLGGYRDGDDVASRLRGARVSRVTVEAVRPLADEGTEPPTPDESLVPTEPMALANAVRGAPDLPGAEAASAALALAPDSPDAPARLAAAAAAIRDAMDHGRWSTAVRAVADLVQLEAAARGATREAFSKALDPLLTSTLLQRAAEASTLHGARDAAVRVLRRGGSAGTEVLRDRLLASASAAERDHLFQLLRRHPDGLRQLTLLLQHPTEATVERAADLLGALDVRDAVPALGRALRHRQPGVRRAVAGALSRIGTPAALEHLTILMESGDREAQLCVARAVTGRTLAPLVGLLARAGWRAATPAARGEFARALGRVGTPEAVAALVRWTDRPGFRFWRYRPGLRAAAVEGLRLAGGPAAVGVIERLARDADAEVRGAAEAALDELRAIAAGRRGS